jgi:putative tricarboxylic transport membrane protein
MKKRDRYTSLIWATLGLYISYEGYTLKLGTLGNPQSGFLIFWAGLLLAGLSLLLFLQSFWSTDDKKEKKGLWEGIQWGKGAKLMAALLLYSIVFKWMGFILSTFFLLIFLFKGLEPQKWKIAMVLSIVTISVCYVVFGVFLEMQFPAGLLSGILNR